MSKELQHHGKKTILLIGSTGHGKSSLGNFLLNPDEKCQKKPFATGTSNLPQTKVVQTGTTVDRTNHPLLTVIDTPGLNESATEDLRHMMELVKTLKSIKEISACILCVRFDSKIDTQYKATVNYYRDLLPKVFEGNIVIVLTNFATDKRSVKVRDIQNIDVNAIIQNTAAEVAGGLPYVPQVFLIDSLPVDIDPDDKNRAESEKVRLSIFSYIEKTMDPVSVSELKLAKTDAIRQRERELVMAIDGEIHGYNVRLQQVNAKAEKVLNDIELMEKKKSEFDRTIYNIDEELEDKNSDQKVTAAEWSSRKQWKLFSPHQEETFACVSRWPIAAYTKWDNGNLKWKAFEIHRSKNTITGVVAGDLWRGLYASVTIKTLKRHKYADSICDLQRERREAEEARNKIKTSLERCRQKEKKYSDDIHLLQQYIEEKNHSKIYYSSRYMSLEDAEKRLHMYLT